MPGIVKGPSHHLSLMAGFLEIRQDYYIIYVESLVGFILTENGRGFIVVSQDIPLLSSIAGLRRDAIMGGRFLYTSDHYMEVIKVFLGSTDTKISTLRHVCSSTLGSASGPRIDGASLDSKGIL